MAHMVVFSWFLLPKKLLFQVRILNLSHCQIPLFFSLLSFLYIKCSLQGHGHWVNSLALSTEYVLRTGAFDHTGKQYSSSEEMKQVGNFYYVESSSYHEARNYTFISLCTFCLYNLVCISYIYLNIICLQPSMHILLSVFLLCASSLPLW